MTNTTTLSNLKAAGRYAEAGALAYTLDVGRDYGCHFGMRSTRLHAVREFERGYDEAAAEANVSAMEERAIETGETQRRGYVSIAFKDGLFAYCESGKEIDRTRAVVLTNVSLRGSATTIGEHV